MKKKLSFKNFKESLLKDPRVKKKYDALKPEFDFIHALIQARKKAKISQEQIADMLDTKQPAIARLELGGFEKSSLSTIRKYAAALGYDLHLRLVKKSGHGVHIHQ